MIEEIFNYGLKFFVITQCLIPLGVLTAIVFVAFVINLLDK